MKRPLKSFFAPEYCSIVQAAIIAGCDRNTIKDHVRAGYLKLYRLPMQHHPKLKVADIRALYLPVELTPDAADIERFLEEIGEA